MISIRRNLGVFGVFSLLIVACGDAGIPQENRTGYGYGSAPTDPSAGADGGQSAAPPSTPAPAGAPSPGPTAPDATAPTTTSDVFTGAPPFAAHTASSTHHAGQDCTGSCHSHGFTFAGTLTDGSGGGVAGAEVRLVDKNGTAISVYTDSSGNFHSASAWAAPAQIGARNAASVAAMVAPLGASDGGCNGCHATSGSVAPIHLP